jgi:uridylate kinase
MAQYKRILLKLSGESFANNSKNNIDQEMLEFYAREIKHVYDEGVGIAIVPGGGNIWRGDVHGKTFHDQPQSHYIGMLAGVINCLALQDALEGVGIPTRVMTALAMQSIAEPYIRRKAIRHLEKGRIVILGGGTGNPFFTHDSAAVLRAAEIHAEVLLMGKNGVDGVYSADPKKDLHATKYDELDYMRVLNDNLRVMDSTALTFAKERKLPIIVFDVQAPGTLMRVVNGEKLGTFIRD